MRILRGVVRGLSSAYKYDLQPLLITKQSILISEKGEPKVVTEDLTDALNPYHLIQQGEYPAGDVPYFSPELMKVFA